MNDPSTKDLNDDIFLLRLIQSGDKKAFKYLFNMFFASLCRFIRVYVKSNQVAEEIALDIFSSIWENKEKLEIKLTWKAYLFQAARNRALNYIRDTERFVSVSDWSNFDKYEIDYSLEIKELENLIQEAICSLPERCQDVFCKSRFEALSNKEIADKLQIPVKNVEAQITKALKLIKVYLGESYIYFW
ncbi:MAG: RNA polymerase sigma-70 factor [Parabacteroides sp.]|nr:RNA polymerase sigma-70 factor [Parabacteroides sp.]